MKRRSLLMLLVCIMFLLVSCGQQDAPPTPTPEPAGLDINEVTFRKTPVLLSEAHDSVGAPYGLNKTMELAERNDVTYAFEPQISLKDRAECIRATEAILGRIGIDRNIRVNVYTTGTYDCTFVEDGSVYTHLQDWRSPEYVSTLLYGQFGEYCNYGMIYGYAAYLCHTVFDLPLDVMEADWSFRGDLNTLDLSLLCFRPEFVSAEDIENVKKISNTFVSEYMEVNGEAGFRRLLENSGTVEGVGAFVEALAAFYGSRNIDHTPTELLYRLGGRGYDYIVKCPYAVMYIEKDWFDGNKELCPYTYDGFLHQNYNDTKQYFTINIEEMEKFRALFALDSYNDDLNIYFTKHGRLRTSYYLAGTHSIVADNTASLGHEYIHSLTNGQNILEPWAHEGFARYFSYYYNYYGNAMSTVDYNSTPLKYILEYKANIGRDIDMATDFAEIFHITTYACGFDDPNDGYGYIPGASFIDYLISRFGEETVIEIICVTHDFGEYTYSELVADWQAFIQENYSGYSKH